MHTRSQFPYLRSAMVKLCAIQEWRSIGAHAEPQGGAPCSSPSSGTGCGSPIAGRPRALTRRAPASHAGPLCWLAAAVEGQVMKMAETTTQKGPRGDGPG